ncbi:MAG: hypothetical protein IPK61_17800 [Saprospiraceae bacterium]|nr:hypothetical protein [Saprospiraceae bacterium]
MQAGEVRSDDLGIKIISLSALQVFWVDWSPYKKHTKRVFLESAHFQASSIRLSSMGHNIRTQAAKCFEKAQIPMQPSQPCREQSIC